MADMEAEPFVVVGMPRTGSTLLCDCLSQNEEIEVHGELFHPNKTQRQGKHAVYRGEKKHWYDGEQDPLVFLREILASRRSASGFKLFAEHTAMPAGLKIFERIREGIEGIRFVHMVRDNYLEVLISRVYAHLTGVWEIQQVAALPDLRVYIDPNDATGFFDRMESVNEFFRSSLTPARYIRVNFDQLAARPTTVIEEVEKFLGVPIHTPSIRSVRLTPLRRIAIANLDELRAAVRGTRYESFFTYHSSAADEVSAGVATTRAPRAAFLPKLRAEAFDNYDLR